MIVLSLLTYSVFTLCRVVMASSHLINMDNLVAMVNELHHHRAMDSHQELAMVKHPVMVHLANSLVCTLIDLAHTKNVWS